MVADDKREDVVQLDRPLSKELIDICRAADFTAVSVAAQVDFKKLASGIYRAAVTTPPGSVSSGYTTVAPDELPQWGSDILELCHAVSETSHARKDLNAASGTTFRSFLTYARKECPASRTLLLCYGHASGPMGLFFDRDARTREPNTLRIDSFARALASSRTHADLIVFRDCYMGTLETAYELRGVSSYVLASQAEAPVAGVWPWTAMMEALGSGRSLADAARALATLIGTHLDDPANRTPLVDVPMALLDLGKTEPLVAPLAELVTALDATRLDPARESACALALGGARRGHNTGADPGDPSIIDVLTMCRNLQALSGDPVVAPAAALEAAVRALITWSHAQDPVRFQGVGLYYKPMRTLDKERSFIYAEDFEDQDGDHYKRLALCAATGWHRIALKPLEALS